MSNNRPTTTTDKRPTPETPAVANTPEFKERCFAPLLNWMADSDEMSHWAPILEPLLERKLANVNHGDLPGWIATLNKLPHRRAQHIDLGQGCLQIGQPDELSDEEALTLEQGLRALIPWRKGPYNLFGIHIDTEWRSDFKWDRLIPHISPLHNRLVLDIGCGNGYHMWRMLDSGARRVLGIDPSWKFLIQFQAIKQYLAGPTAQCDTHTDANHALPVDLLPLGIEDLPAKMRCFDTVFSMGVFYHRKSPMDHLQELLSLLRPGGELVLETLVIPGDENAVLVPQDRYAQMRNVWFLPSVAALTRWMQRMGLVDVQCVDVNQTSLEEQRATDWMLFHSLENFLDPADHSRTIEGYPAPTRAIMIAKAPY